MTEENTFSEKPCVIEREDFEGFGVAAGVRLLDVVEGAPKYNYVELPPGWRKLPHRRWNEGQVVDEKDRRRASFRLWPVGGANKYVVWPLNRFQFSHVLIENSLLVGHVRDDGKLIYATESVAPKQGEIAWLRAENAAKAWLDENYPDWRKPGAYWD